MIRGIVMRFSGWPLAAAFSLTLLGLTACAEDPKPVVQTAAPIPAPSLYQRLGEKAGITAVVDDFVVNIAGDQRVNRFFKKTKIPTFKMHLVNQICAGTGGPCQYTGRSMKVVHKSMGITDANFAAVVEDLQKSLNKFKVASQDQTELLNILGTMKADIVTAPAKAKPAAKPAPAAKPKPAAAKPAAR